MGKKITQYPASAGNPDVTSLIDISEFDGSIYTSKKLSITQLIDFLNTNLNLGSSFTFANTTGSTISRGIPVILTSGVSGGFIKCDLLSASFSTNGLSQIYIANEDILNGNSGTFIQNGFLNSIDTSAYGVGEKLFWDVDTQLITNDGNLDDQIFIGIVTVSDVNGQIFVSPTRSPQLVKGQANQIPLFIGDRNVSSNNHFTFLDNVGSEVGFTFNDELGNETKTGVNLISIKSNDDGNNSSINLSSYNDSTVGNYLDFRKSRGSELVTTQILTDDVLGQINFTGSSLDLIDEGSPTAGAMQVSEIIIKSLINFGRNYDSGLNTTYADGQTEYSINLMKNGATISGNGVPLLTKMFSVNSYGEVEFQNYKFPIADGTPLQVISTDGSGQLGWSNLPNITSTSELTNDGENGVNPFITALDIPTFASADKMVTIGRNSTGSTLYKGTIVYILGSTGNRPNFVKARANVEATSAGTFGVIESDILNNADGNCVTIGTIGNLDTRSTATNPFTVDTLADGDTIYLSPTTAGYITNVKPSAPNHLVYIGKVVRTSPTLGTIVYRIQNGYELEELHNVAISGSLLSGDILQYDSPTSLWKNKVIPTASGTDNGYLTSADWTTFNNKVATTRTLTINGTTYDLSANRSWTVASSSGIFGITDSSGVYTYYATLILAMASASSGQTIEMFSDYIETSGAVTLKNGVNINGNGHTYTLNKTGSNNTFTDGGVAVDCSIDNIKIIRTGGTTSLTDNVCLSLSGASNIKTTAIFSTTGALCILLNNASCYLSGGKSYVINYSGAYVTLGNLSNHYVELQSSGYHYGIYCASGTLINCHGISKGSVYYAVIQIDAGTATNCSAISTTAGGYGPAFINGGNALNCSGHSISVGGFKNNGKAENCSGFSTSSTGFASSGFGININCAGFSISGIGLGGYNGHYIGCSGYSTGNYGISVTNGNDGQVHVLNCSAMSTASSGASFGYYPNNGGIKNCTIKTLYNSASGHGVELSALNSVSGCNIQVVSASANCIYKSTAGTIKYASNTFEGATTVVNANITQGVTNTHDSQGNILM